MARSLSDDPATLERELDGIRGRARLIQIRLMRLEPPDYGVDVTPIEEVHEKMEELRACIVKTGTFTPQQLIPDDELEAGDIDF